jgi:hypothetical protein
MTTPARDNPKYNFNRSISDATKEFYLDERDVTQIFLSSLEFRLERRSWLGSFINDRANQ